MVEKWKPDLRIRSHERLRQHLVFHKQDAHCGDSVDTLLLDLPGIRPSSLRAFFEAVPNLESLTLVLHAPGRAPNVPSVFFPSLVLFKSNLPHLKVEDFLKTNTAVRSLSLTHSCEDDCSLAGAGLNRVSDLEITAACANAVAHPQLLRLTVWTNDGPKRDLGISLTLRGLPETNVAYLTIDFHPWDLDIISSIAVAAPRVRKLKLVEIFTAGTASRRGSSLRNVINDRKLVHAGLRRLPFLEQLVVETSASLLRADNRGDAEAEENLLCVWLEGSKKGHTLSDFHGQTYHVRLQYAAKLSSAGGYTGGFSSDWNRQASGEWLRTTHTRDASTVPR